MKHCLGEVLLWQWGQIFYYYDYFQFKSLLIALFGAFFAYAILSTTIHQQTGVDLVFEGCKTVQEVLNMLSMAWILFQWVNLDFLLVSSFPIVSFPCIVGAFTVSCCYYFCIKINKLKYRGENPAFSGQGYGAQQ